jgi:hypothetical protein
MTEATTGWSSIDLPLTICALYAFVLTGSLLLEAKMEPYTDCSQNKHHYCYLCAPKSNTFFPQIAFLFFGIKNKNK